MNIQKAVFLVMVVTLSGCAHHVGYQRSYVGFGGSYGGASSYYDYPSSYYYQSSPIIYYDRHYMTPHYSGRHDWDRSNRHWRPTPKHHYTPRWKPNVPDRHEHPRKNPAFGSRPFHRNPPNNPGRLHNQLERRLNHHDGRSMGEHRHRNK